MKYWLVVSTPENFRITRDTLNFKLLGLSNRYREKVYRMNIGDKIIFYISKIKKFGAIACVNGTSYRDKNEIWLAEKEKFPLRIPVENELLLTDAELELLESPFESLEFIKHKDSLKNYFRVSVREIGEKDFNILRQALLKVKNRSDTQ
ncbi:MAG: EVE domain-containing protein [Nitrospirae bacterium]|nr:EVE domain-containing protein [Nitrospirota bacterium]